MESNTNKGSDCNQPPMVPRIIPMAANMKYPIMMFVFDIEDCSCVSSPLDEGVSLSENFPKDKRENGNACDKCNRLQGFVL